MKLLIVEDDRLLSNALARSLRDAYAVDQAFDGEEGLFYAAQDVYDLVVLDVMLPERDGFSVLEALRAQGVDTPVLMLTARSATADKLRGLRSGADDYLAKPFDRDELLARIEAILGSLISKERLFDKIWGFMSDTSSNVVEVYVSALRKALAPTGYDRYIKTIRGAGYLFTEDDHD